MSIFNASVARKPKRSKFDLSFDNKMSINFGWLYPTLCQEILPGDKIKHKHQLFMQMAPLNSMVMHRFDVRTEYFFVPCRLLYDEWPKAIVGGDDGDTDYVFPQISIEAALHAYPDFLTPGELPDMLGIADFGSTSRNYYVKQNISLLPFRAYQLIYNEFYRDENLIPETEFSIAGGNFTLDAMSADPSDTSNPYYELFSLRRRAYPKDYFTSCLPAPQAGTAVKIPFGRQEVRMYEDSSLSDLHSISSDGRTLIVGVPGSSGEITSVISGNSSSPLDTRLGTYSEGEGTIDELRTAIKVQEWKERHARGGGRYKETLAAHFGVIVPDYRIDRPVYLRGTRDVFTLGNIYSTQFNQTDVVQGYPVSNAIAGGISKSFTLKAAEHGFLIGLTSVYPKAAYFQGLSRSWQRFDKFDYYWPEFAQLGEQAVYTKEVYGNAPFTIDVNTGVRSDEVFGYQSRYAEYKHNHDQVHGDFRTDMNMFHDARRFTSSPTLSKNFIEVNPSVDDTNRIYNDTLDYNAHILVDIFHNIKALRPMPYFGIPKI